MSDGVREAVPFFCGGKMSAVRMLYPAFEDIYKIFHLFNDFIVTSCYYTGRIFVS